MGDCPLLVACSNFANFSIRGQSPKGERICSTTPDRCIVQVQCRLRLRVLQIHAVGIAYEHWLPVFREPHTDLARHAWRLHCDANYLVAAAHGALVMRDDDELRFFRQFHYQVDEFLNVVFVERRVNLVKKAKCGWTNLVE